ncbi:hypothetical protein [Nocardia blacklockiae]|uniref:restriction system modified-DNA reader domain-containing protein n=1 Tax=Nocardia blacklockiae TaxID=480036 RepID=UPI0018941C73|nr:hypothetical protein [Nocardia blacklockiae]MBF6171803.1 hypothetical protein [Nocardia blacklockiae]
MKHTIVIDDEVFSMLVKHRQDFEQPNDVLRRLLITGGSESFRASSGLGITGGATESIDSFGHGVETGRPGRLVQLVKAGLVAAGDELRHDRVRSGQTLKATVTANGSLQTSQGFYDAPSPALRDLVGSQVDGWKNWVHVRSGKSLRELRDSLR